MAKSRMHSVLTALPVLMLVGGLYVYYTGEQSQREGALLMVDAVRLEGPYGGFSVVKSGGEGQHYLWISTEGRSRGIRVSAEHHTRLEAVEPPLDETQVISVEAAPRVSGSRVLWLATLRRNGETLISSLGTTDVVGENRKALATESALTETNP